MTPRDTINRMLQENGIDPLESKFKIREELVELRQKLKQAAKHSDERKKLVGLIKKKEHEYSLVFHDWFAELYPHLLFERSEEKVYWIYNDAEGIYDEIRPVDVRSLVMHELRKDGMIEYMTETHARNIIARYRADYPGRGKRYEDFDASDQWFHANNGWLSLNSRKFTGHSPDRLSRRKSAVDYDKNATCPVYDRFIDEDVRIQKDEIRVLDQFSGLLLTHDVRHQKMLTIIGRPGSGKSTLLDTWSYILGDLVTKNALTDFSGDKYRFMGSSLQGRTLCWFDEVEVKRAEMSSVLERKITAQEIEIERKGIDGTRYAPNFLKFILTANTLPLSAEQGIYRRLMIIPFEHSFTDDESADRDIFDKLKNESSGILNRMLNGLEDLRKMGTFTMVAGHDERIEAYKASSNTISEFLDTYFEPVLNDPDGVVHERIPSQKVFEAYDSWIGRSGFQLTPQRFGQMIANQPLNRFQHIRPCKGAHGVRMWNGLKLHHDYEWVEDERTGKWKIRLINGDDDGYIQRAVDDF